MKLQNSLKNSMILLRMEKYNVVISNTTREDIYNIYRYICYELLLPDTAKKQIIRIETKILSLTTFPKRIKVFYVLEGYQLRSLKIDNYNIIYTILSNKLYIVRILSSYCNIREKLKNYRF